MKPSFNPFHKQVWQRSFPQQTPHARFPHASLNVHVLPKHSNFLTWTETWQTDTLGAIKPHLLISLFSLPFSLLVLSLYVPCVFNVFPLLHCVCVCVYCLFPYPCLCDSFDLVYCVLVCCRHCSPVHCFFSVFTAHHWASLSVCLPNLHPKFQLFIYNQLVRYCTVLSTSSPTPPPRPALPHPTPPHPMEHACVHPLALGPCRGGTVNDEWLDVLLCLGFFFFKLFPGWNLWGEEFEWKLDECPRKVASMK